MRVVAPLVLLFLLPGMLAAQSRSIYGIVRVRADNSVIAGATLEVAGTRIQAVTATDGRFMIEGLRADTVVLHVSRFGIRTHQVTVATTSGHVEIFVEEEAVAIPQVAVTGTRDARRETSPFQVLTADSEELTLQGDVTLSDVLLRTAGITSQGSQGYGRELRMRGMSSEYTQVLVDGQPLANMNDRRAFQIDRLPLALVERVVILRNTTARMPSQAVAGTVNIVMRPIPMRSTFGWDVNVGSGDPAAGTAVMGGGGVHFGDVGDRFGYVVSAAFDQHRNPQSNVRVATRAGVAGLETIDESLKQTYDEISVAPRISYGLGASALTLASLYVRGTSQRSADRTITGDLAPKSEGDAETSRYHTWRMQLGWAPASGTVGFLVGANGMRDSRNKNWNRVDADPLLTHVENDSKDEIDFFAAARWQLHAGPHEVTLGSDASTRRRTKDRTRFETLRNGTLVDRGTAADQYEFRESEAAAFIEGQLALSPATLLTPGLRVEALSTTTRDRRGIEGEQTGIIVVPVLHMLMKLDRKTNLRGALTRTVRRPRFDNLVEFFDVRSGSFARPDLAGNPLLEEERAVSFEATFERFTGRGSNFGISALTKHVKDRIEPTIIQDTESGRYTEVPINAGDGRMFGLEMDGSTLLPGPLKALRGWGNLSLYHSRLTDPVTGERRRFNRQPSYVLNAGAAYHHRDLGIRLGASVHRTPENTRVESINGTRQTESEDVGDLVSAYISKTLGGAVLTLSVLDLLEAERLRNRATARPDGTPLSTVNFFESGNRRILIALRSVTAK